ncbi:MAG: energy transducer TonB [Hyphomonadaceae bacterium]|nr:energy transducer TonB [Hyphomonadaceae bacterium]
MTIEEIRSTSDRADWAVHEVEDARQVLSGGPNLVLGGARFGVSLVFEADRLVWIILSASGESACANTLPDMLVDLEPTFGAFSSAPSPTERGRLVEISYTPGGSEIRRYEAGALEETSSSTFHTSRRAAMFIQMTGEPDDDAEICRIRMTFSPEQATDAGQEVTLAEIDGAQSLVNPLWIERPDGRSFARHYPDQAMAGSIDGAATLDCLVAADGRLRCRITMESPLGAGFGAAALRIASHFRVLEDRSGASAIGKRVRIPIRFDVR